MPNVREIVKEWLEQHGYEGLYSDHWECGCTPEDLMPCGEASEDCVAGYKWPGDGEVDFFIKPDKPEATDA
jgi:hypothetical protein